MSTTIINHEHIGCSACVLAAKEHTTLSSCWFELVDKTLSIRFSKFWLYKWTLHLLADFIDEFMNEGYPLGNNLRLGISAPSLKCVSGAAEPKFQDGCSLQLTWMQRKTNANEAYHAYGEKHIL